MPASIPIRHGGRFASRDTILARATFSRSTIAPRASRPTRCNVFLPGSIPMVTTAVLDLCAMAWFLLLTAPQACSLVGREHGRSIPFPDFLRWRETRDLHKIRACRTPPEGAKCGIVAE